METGGVKWTDVAQLVVSLVGFCFVVYQIRQLSKTVAGDAYTSLYEQYVEVGKILLDRPHLRPYFYADLQVDAGAPGSANTLAEIEIICELLTGLLEHAALQRHSMPSGIYEQCWQAYTKERYQKSPALREFWAGNKTWYAREFHQIVHECINARQADVRAVPGGR